MRIKGTSVSICRLCENSETDEKNELICKLQSTPEKCKSYKYDIFRYEPQKNILNNKFTKEDFEI